MKKNFLIILCLAALATSCNSMLNLEPHSAISPSSVTEDDLPQLRTGMYWKVQELPQSESYIINDLLGGNLTNKGSNSTITLINNILTPQNGLVSHLWCGSYEAIYQIHVVMNSLEKLPEGTLKTQILGECHYFRALMYLQLVTHFGDVPLLKSPVNEDIARTDKEEVWNFIEEELQAAAGQLGVNSDKYYLSSDAAKALLARVKIYRGKKAEALTLAEELLGNSKYALDSFDNIFDKKAVDTEIIFAFKCLAEDGSDVRLSSLYYPTSFGGSLVYQPAPDIQTLFDATDTRAGKTYTTMGSSVVINKFPSGKDPDPSIISRLAEMYLISAEAQGYPVGLNRLNQLRRFRGLSDITVSSQGAFSDALALEYRREFVSENHLFYDLVRTGKAVSVLGIQPYQQLLPIPERELNTNKKLLQNPGY